MVFSKSLWPQTFGGTICQYPTEDSLGSDGRETCIFPLSGLSMMSVLK